MQFWKVTADVSVDRYHVPRRDNQVVEVGEGGLDDVVEEVHLDLRGYGVEGLAFDALRYSLQPDSLALVRGMLDDLFTLARVTTYELSITDPTCIQGSTYLEYHLPQLWTLLGSI